MSVREALNRYPKMTAAVTIVAILLAAGSFVYMRLPEKPPKVQTRMFFTADDGKTWFPDQATRLAPFDRDGREAVEAHVYRCGDREFVGYMERTEPEARKKLEELMKGGVNAGNAPQIGVLRGTKAQRKKPGDADWVGVMEDNSAFNVMAKVTCENGKASEAVMPEIP